MIKIKMIQLMRMGIDWGTICGTFSMIMGFFYSPIMMILGIIATVFGLIGGYYTMKKKKYEAQITEIDLEAKIKEWKIKEWKNKTL